MFPFYVGTNGEIMKITMPDFKVGTGGIFIINTGIDRKTEPLVKLFLENCKDASYLAKIENILLKVNDHCISSLLEGDTESLYDHFGTLSEFQYSEFSKMIPANYKSLWLDGLKGKDYFLKLCGAGAGGFLLGITKNFGQIEQDFKNYEIRPILRFF